jgi:catechol 2,3-dioxygenase-like lactoylglutathione lyase family enzyme
VHSIAEVTPFYDAFMPAVGMHHKRAIGDHVLYYRKIGKIPAECIILFEEPAHRASETVLAFYAATYEEVDTVANTMKNAGFTNIEGPMRYPEYSETYYAAFFRDPSGNRLEIVCRRPAG